MWKRVVLATAALLLVVLVLPGCGVSQDNNADLQQQLSRCQQSDSTQKQEIARLTAANAALQASYDNLSVEYQALQVLRIGHLLEDYYNEIRDDHSGFVWWLFNGTQQDSVTFAADLARHGLGETYWPSHEDDYYSDAKEHSYTTAREELDAVLGVIGIQATDSPTQKIDKILDFIQAHIHYESDLNDAFLAPMETLGFLSGDCDDYSILAAALFKAVGIDSAIGFFQSGSSGHAMTLVHLDSINPYGCWYYSDLTTYGLQPGRWLVIEPQTTIENQQTDSVHKWTIQAAAEV
ncbi:MAG: transglutaminase-like domain-containing protein [Dehalococcoidia bacterium]|nr:transglutaminase-like domain-containing protein [Dehalococcoidia bacterium]